MPLSFLHLPLIRPSSRRRPAPPVRHLQIVAKLILSTQILFCTDYGNFITGRRSCGFDDSCRHRPHKKAPPDLPSPSVALRSLAPPATSSYCDYFLDVSLSHLAPHGPWTLPPSRLAHHRPARRCPKNVRLLKLPRPSFDPQMVNECGAFLLLPNLQQIPRSLHSYSLLAYSACFPSPPPTLYRVLLVPPIALTLVARTKAFLPSTSEESRPNHRSPLT